MDCIYHLNIEYIQQLAGEGEDSDAEEMPDGEFAVTSDHKSDQSRWYSSTALPLNPNGARFGKYHFARGGYWHGMRSQRGNKTAVGCSDCHCATFTLPVQHSTPRHHPNHLCTPSQYQSVTKSHQV
jgi:hypothetical protein